MSGAGKGDKYRPVNKKKYDKNYSEINWDKTRVSDACWLAFLKEVIISKSKEIKLKYLFK